ncbi:MAG: pilus assembly protein PilM [Polyangiaceae bacterium]
MANHIGIDIGTSAVKAVRVRSQFKRLRVEAVATVEVLAAGSVEAAVHQALSEVTGGKPQVHDGLAAALAGDRTAVRVLSIPASAQRQVGEVLPFELESAVPFDIAEAVWDYRILTTARPAGVKDGHLAVLTVVARIDDARERIDFLKRVTNQEPEALGVGAFPLANVLPYLAAAPAPTEPATPVIGAGSILFLDLGTKRSDMLVLSGDEPVFARTMTIGAEGLPGTAAKLARELKTSLAALRAAGHAEPSRVILCGGGAFIQGAQAYLSAELGIPIEVLGLRGIEFAENLPPDVVALAPRWTKALGLALSLGGRPADVNLRKGPLGFERGFAWIKEKIPVLAGLTAVLMLGFMLSSLVELLALSKERTTLEKSLEMVTGEVLGEATSSAEKANSLLAAQSASADEDPMAHADAFDVLARLTDVIPQSAAHDIEELDVQKGHVRVNGVVASVNDAQAIAASLKGEKDESCFSDVKITRTTQVIGSDRQKYVLEFDLKCPEDQKVKKKEAAPAGSASASSAASGGGK